MMRKIGKYLLVMVLVVAYGFYIYTNDHQKMKGHKPVINVPSGVLKLSTSANKNDVLSGVTASDQEDGDITNKLFIENESAFGENNIRQVTIGVFDKDDNLTRVTRSIQYTDYQKPVITLKKALIFTYVSSKAQFADYVKAYSSVDGDISSRVSVVREYLENDNTYVTFQVKDSTGTRTRETFKADSITKNQTISISLKEYLIHVNKGETVRPLNYVDEIKVGSIDQTAVLKDKINCTPATFTAKQKGTYEIFYKLMTRDDDYGVTKLVIIVD
ncbi:hypothetical protein [Sharpea azabuensis]|uniref:Ig-like domain (Group 3) n=1 Tax=Sharpea azabuensis TaxID=322505 RepID=A0A1H6VVX8_9FIRM|nr:hypothetical protein [Sharpea azabuensis]SEJ04205.1 hypothetical protein SAMN04487834_10484 [Sharpea azabuensis]